MPILQTLSGEFSADETIQTTTGPGGKDRAGLGEEPIKRLAGDLSTRFGRGFSRQNLQQIRTFFLVWPIKAICQTPSGKSSVAHLIADRFPLTWSAYVRLLSVKNKAARRIYETKALCCGCSVRQFFIKTQREIDDQIRCASPWIHPWGERRLAM
jgi:hypothetical protein